MTGLGTVTPWRRFDVVRHDGHLDDLVVDALGPVVRDLAAAGRPSYLARHWQRGPHVRLVVEHDEGVPELLARHVGPWVVAHPSTAVLDEAALAPRYAAQAAAEQVEGPLLPHHPDNTVVPTIEVVRDRQLGSSEAWLLFRWAYVRMTPMLLDVLQRVRAGADRRATCLSLMFFTAEHAVPGGIEQGQVSFRSHAEAYLAESDPSGTLRRRWTELGAGWADPVDDALGEAVAGGCEVPGWPQLLEELQGSAASLVEAEAFALRRLQETSDPDAARRTGERNRRSPFHAALAADVDWGDRVESTTWFRTYRICLNLAYHLMTQLGTSATERYFLCHLAADAAERRASATSGSDRARGHR